MFATIQTIYDDGEQETNEPIPKKRWWYFLLSKEEQRRRTSPKMENVYRNDDIVINVDEIRSVHHRPVIEWQTRGGGKLITDGRLYYSDVYCAVDFNSTKALLDALPPVLELPPVPADRSHDITALLNTLLNALRPVPAADRPSVDRPTTEG